MVLMKSIVFNMAGLIITGVDITTLFYPNPSQEITLPKKPSFERFDILFQHWNR